ncbi:MAG: 50S ribosomal protein L4 [Candidatus Omnitrophota bacterium]|nr:50S ribosomal protein L4 [Candidatus Omnitrophota bacterium]
MKIVSTAKQNVFMNIDVVNVQGKIVDTIELDPFVFDGKVNSELIHQAVVTYLSNQRKGLACTKTRGEVSGGGRKPWRQKGTGRARAGSTRSPLWRKGGITFGPKPHSFYKDFPKKMKISALKSALNSKANDKEIIVLDNLDVSSGKTKDFFKIVQNLKLDNAKLRFVVSILGDNLKRAYRNIKSVGIGTARNLNTYDALDCKNIIFTKAALLDVQERVKKCLA